GVLVVHPREGRVEGEDEPAEGAVGARLHLGRNFGRGGLLDRGLTERSAAVHALWPYLPVLLLVISGRTSHRGGAAFWNPHVFHVWAISPSRCRTLRRSSRPLCHVSG